MPTSPITHVRRICLALPEATEKTALGEPTFRVRDKLFAMYTDNHHGDGVIAVWCAAEPGAQDALVGADPRRFYVPPYMGPRGWIGVYLDRDPDWDLIAALVRDAYRKIAPKRLSALLPA